MEQKRNFITYLDQNIFGNLREGEPAKEQLSRKLEQLRVQGATYVYSEVHVEECRAFYEPEQYVRVLDEIDAYYILPTEHMGQDYEIKPKMAKELILCEPDFASKSIAFLSNQITLSQFALGWLGELEAEELKCELEAEIDLWVEEVQRETLGLCETSSIRQKLLDSLLSLDLNKIKHEGLEQQPQTERERNERFSRIDKLASDEVVDFIFSEIGHDAAQHLSGMFPKKAWPNGAYTEIGSLTGLTLLLFTQGVGRDSKVKRGSQLSRRKRFQAQFCDCRHIEAAARCDLFLSNDNGAVALAKAAYAYAGVKTIAKHVSIHHEQ